MLEHPVTVFIVDDSPQLTEMLSELINDPGTVEVAGVADSAKRAVADIGLSMPDVVIVDLQVKDGTGFDVVKAIRALPKNKDITVILFTNHASRELQNHATKLGADYFLDKSQDYPQILEILQEKVRARRKQNLEAP